MPYKQNELLISVDSKIEESFEEAKLKYQLGKAALEALPVKQVEHFCVFPTHRAQVHVKIYCERRNQVPSIFERFNVLPLMLTKELQFVPVGRPLTAKENISPFYRRLGDNDESIEFYARLPISRARQIEMQLHTPAIAGQREIEIQVTCNISRLDETLVVVQNQIQWDSPLWKETQYWAADRIPSDVFGDYRNE